jgi:hypothetical protein
MFTLDELRRGEADGAAAAACAFGHMSASSLHAGLSGHRGSTTKNMSRVSRFAADFMRLRRYETQAAATASTNGGLAKNTPSLGRQPKHDPMDPKGESTSPAAEQKAGIVSGNKVVFKGLANSSASRPMCFRRQENTSGGHAA